MKPKYRVSKEALLTCYYFKVAEGHRIINMKSKFLATSKRAIVFVVLAGMVMLYGGQPILQAQAESRPANPTENLGGFSFGGASQLPELPPVATPAVTTTQTETVPAVTPTPVVTPQATPVVTPTPTSTSTPKVTVTPAKEAPKAETKSEEPKPIWQENGQGSFTTTEPVKLGEVYTYPGRNLELKFTQLPTLSGKVTIRKVAASAVPISGVVGDVYDITSTMADGTFKYELSLPYDKSGSNVQVVYSEDAKNFTPVEQGKVDVLAGEKQVKAADLNHFTYFAVVSGQDASDGSAQTFNVSELADLQTANNWSGYVQSDSRWPLWNYDSGNYIQFNLGSVVPADASVSGATLHFRYARGVMGIIPFLFDTYGARLQAQDSNGNWVDIADVWNDNWLTFRTYNVDLTSFFQNNPTLQNLSIRFQMYGGNLLFPFLGGMRSYHDWVGLDIQTIPGVPTINHPIEDSVMINSATTSTHYLSGTAEPGSTVKLYINGSPTTWTVTADSSGNFLFPNNILTAVGIDYDFDYMIPIVATVTSSNADGESAPSRGISYTKDTYAPGDVNLLSPADDSFVNTDGLVMDWTDAVDSNQPNDSGIAGYIYESYRDEAMTNLAYRSTLLTESEIPAPGTPDGDYWWHVKSIDVAGNEGQWSTSWQVTVDNIAPAIPTSLGFNVPPEGTPDDRPVDLPCPSSLTNQNRVAHVWTDESASGAVEYERQWQYPGTTTWQGAERWTTTNTDYRAFGTDEGIEGYWNVRVRARDAANNWSAFGMPCAITLDRTAPGAPILVSPTDGTIQNSNSVLYTWEPGSDLSQLDGYELSLFLNGVPAMQFMIDDPADTQLLVPSVDGVWDWQVRSQDLAGNFSPWSARWQVTVDTVAPGAPVLVSPTDDTIQNSSQIQYVWEPGSDISQLDGYELSLFRNGVPAMQFMIDDPSVTQVTVPSLDGVWDWQVRSQDLAGNFSPWSARWQVTVDTVAPGAPVLVSPADGTIQNSNSVLYTWEPGSDISQLDGYELSLFWNGIPAMQFMINDPAVTQVPVPSIDGVWEWKVRSKDLAGNFSPWSARWRVTVDTVAPNAPILSDPIDGALLDHSDVTLKWNQEPRTLLNKVSVLSIDTFEVDVDGVVTSGVTANELSGSFADGQHHWKVRAKDAAGNYSDWSATWSFTVDTTAPGTPALINPPHESLLNYNNVNLDWTDVTDNIGLAGYELEINSTALGLSPVTSWIDSTVSQFQTVGLPDGVYSWRVRAKDNAGHYSNWSETRTYTVDRTAPAAPTGVQATYISSGTVQVSWDAVSDADHYVIYRNGVKIAEVRGATTYNDSGLSETKHEYYVSAVDAAGNEGAQGGPGAIDLSPTPTTGPTSTSPTTGPRTTTGLTTGGTVLGVTTGTTGALLTDFGTGLDTGSAFSGEGTVSGAEDEAIGEEGSDDGQVAGAETSDLKAAAADQVNTGSDQSWWQTWWFWLLLIIAVILITWLIAKRRKKDDEIR